MTAGGSFVMGAVAYDAKVVTIWDGFRAWFRGHDLDFDYVLYSCLLYTSDAADE